MREFAFFATPYLGQVLLFYMVRQILPGKVPAWKMLIYLLPGFLIHIPKWYLGSGSLFAQIYVSVAMCAACIIYPLLFFRGAKWKRIATVLFFQVVLTSVDMACYTLFVPQYGINLQEYPLAQLIYYTALDLSMFALVGSLCVLLFRSVAMRKFQAFYLLFPVFPVSQSILLFYCIYPSLSSHSVGLLIGVLLGFGAEIALLGYTISQEKKAALEQDLQEARHTMTLERAHYQAVEERRERLDRIRRDFNDRLAEIDKLIRSAEDVQAQKKIQSLAEDIRQTKENPYCAIPVVNAVLTEKLRECEQAGVTLHVELNMPSRLQVEPLHLCSIFSNLLDNAIKGAKTSGTEKPEIRLLSAMEGDYLFIKTVNPSGKLAKRPAAGHGYGLQILRNLAEQYSGEYLSVFENGTYTAIVTLLTEGKK